MTTTKRRADTKGSPATIRTKEDFPADVLVPEELRLAQQQSLEAFARLARGISHSMNTFIAVSGGNLGLLKHCWAQDTNALEMINDALAALMDAELLSTNLAALGNHQPFALKTLRIKDCLGGYVERLHDRIDAGRQVRLDAPANLPLVHVDPQYLELALNAIVKNALEAMQGRESGEICIRVRHSPGPPDSVSITVTDTGGGMVLQRLQRPFEMGAKTKRQHSSLGLGLWYVRQVMLACGGDAAVVEAQPSGGAFVQLSLPCHYPV
jgi:signal transduction histidine kinase